MITWTTYGTWLQGDKRGYVKGGRILRANERLRKANIRKQKNRTVKLNRQEREIVRDAIEQEAEILGQKIYSVAVCSNHVHIVVNCIDETTGYVTGRYKKAASDTLRKRGFVGKVWTKGYDKRYCFNKESLRNKVDYVQKHD